MSFCSLGLSTALFCCRSLGCIVDVPASVLRIIVPETSCFYVSATNILQLLLTTGADGQVLHLLFRA